MSQPIRAVNERQTTLSESSSTTKSRMPTTKPFPSMHSETMLPDGPLPEVDEQSIPNDLIDKGDPSTSTLAGRLRSASRKFEESNLPKGIWDATATIASSIPSLVDVRRGSFGSEGWSAEGQKENKERQNSIAQHHSSQIEEEVSQRQYLSGINTPGRIASPKLVNHQSTLHGDEANNSDSNLQRISPAGNSQAGALAFTQEKDNYLINGNQPNTKLQKKAIIGIAPNALTPASQFTTSPFDNGYHFPPKHAWTESTMIFLVGFWNYTTTWQGFIVVIYGLNVVAWGGMIFLLLCNAAPAMCHPTCDDINSPRRIWIEYDAQILTALFCVTGFGLIPWRFRDLYYLLNYRLGRDQTALRRLGGIHRDWFRLPGSQNLPVFIGPDNVESEASNYPETSLSYPLKSIPIAPLTGVRAPPTSVWKLDYVIWMFVWNTFLQAVLSGIMWGLNRYDRPSWATGLFVALASIVAACAGIMIFIEGKRVKGVEGVPVSEKDQERLKKDEERGILHINNINDAIPKRKRRKMKTVGMESKDRNGNGIMSNEVA